MQMCPAIALNHGGKGTAKIEPGDAFINLNFRSDRQRSKTASLCAARPYLIREARARGRSWRLDWMRDDLELRICTLAEYDAEFESEYGVDVAFPITPHQLNLLANWELGHARRQPLPLGRRKREGIAHGLFRSRAARSVSRIIGRRTPNRSIRRYGAGS